MGRDTEGTGVEVGATDFENDPNGEVQDATSAAEEYFGREDDDDVDGDATVDADAERDTAELVDDEDDAADEADDASGPAGDDRRGRLVQRATRLARENSALTRELAGLRTRVQELEAGPARGDDHPDDIEALRIRVARRLGVEVGDAAVARELSDVGTLLMYMAAGEELPAEMRGRLESRRARLDAIERDRQVQAKLDRIEAAERAAREEGERTRVHQAVSGMLGQLPATEATFLRTGAVGDPAELVARLIAEETEAGRYTVSARNAAQVVRDAALRLDRHYRREAGRYAEALQKAGTSGPVKRDGRVDGAGKQGRGKSTTRDDGGGSGRRAPAPREEERDESFLDFLEREEREERARARRR